MGLDQDDMAASDRGGNGSFRLTTMASSDQQRWSLQKRSDGSGLISEGGLIHNSQRRRIVDLKVREGEGILFEEEREGEHGLERDKSVRRERKR